MCKIIINTEEKCLINTKNGKIARPSCFDTLIAYHSYLLSKRQQEQADQILKDVFKGELVIKNMIDKVQKHDMTKKRK
jgi:hypothetical protein